MTTALTRLWLKFTLESDATFGRGDGVAGMVDTEVQHDLNGLPYLGGKTLKGLLDAECSEILFALGNIVMPKALDEWKNAARFLFGEPGSRIDAQIGKMRVSDAQLPEDLRGALVAERNWDRTVTLESLTAIRRQTAMDPSTGAPQRNALRSMRVILRETPFVATLDFDADLIPAKSKCLLAACVQSFRRAGTGRNRGRGKLKAGLYDHDPFDQSAGKPVAAQPIPAAWLGEFEKEVRGASANISH